MTGSNCAKYFLCLPALGPNRVWHRHAPKISDWITEKKRKINLLAQAHPWLSHPTPWATQTFLDWKIASSNCTLRKHLEAALDRNVPDGFAHAQIARRYGKGNHEDPGNCRPISVLNVSSAIKFLPLPVKPAWQKFPMIVSAPANLVFEKVSLPLTLGSASDGLPARSNH